MHFRFSLCLWVSNFVHSELHFKFPPKFKSWMRSMQCNQATPRHPPVSFAQVKAALTPAAVESSQSDVDSFITFYFQNCEDLFHHQNYLKNIVGFYEQREMEHWRVVEEKVGVCDSVILGQQKHSWA
ncbi:hypothetical protein BCR33DRAFT_363976 [Rhizoclosmatium globosum]|uniref:Uncharacterized protein n=1 Tax=Rhizoclosmatium globosum TaxID=329046 RepID=A0A1Y2C092_9FUNG|nr:hypothetical protein BCR33DRAFT_363976 [Rhizoclosmatium globosum]|eukprot:ORY40396.1 hypothetical protein BCR33DRAFT_363976 [Rhizoclosmatium globosum]